MRVVLIVLIGAGCMVAGGLAVLAVIGEWMSGPYIKYAWKRAQWRNVSYEGPSLAGVQSMGPGRRFWFPRGAQWKVQTLEDSKGVITAKMMFRVGRRYDSTDGATPTAGPEKDVEEADDPQASGAREEDGRARRADV